ncbi:MAG TPA: histidine kinase [Longimicrobiales bacterium]|nr:histidine kinase [Longimicrobiales bacterium]
MKSGSGLSAYWKCQIMGWSLFGLVVCIVPTLYAGMRAVVVARAVLGALLGIVFTDQLRRHLWRRNWLQRSPRQLIILVIAGSVAVAVAMVAGALPLLLIIIPPPNSRTGPLAAIFATHIAVVLGWVTIYLAVHYLRSVRAAEAEKWQLQLAMRDTELQALRSQLNPHFLFNSLNSLRGLIAEDPTRAQTAITGLASLLRHTLRHSRFQTTTLERELEATRHYLELESLRFEARLEYRIEVDPWALEHPVPPMLLQTLVENAIKHGIARLPEGGSVRVEVRKPADDLHITITNSGELGDRLGFGGIGIANSMERLRLLSGDRVKVELQESGPQHVVCRVVVPGTIGRPTVAEQPAAAGR